MTTVNAIIQMRRDTAANLAAENAVYASGELVFETDTLRIKVGDGSTAYNSLTYLSADAAAVQLAGALMDSELTDEAAVKALNQGVSTTDSPTFANISVTGNVDGRDVSVDGTKLDGIEVGATADQTGAEIKTLYEAEANTNAFTDAEKTKLSGIETNADVTDTANVTAAGALMDSELTNIAAVKALNQGVATTDSPTFEGLSVSTTGEGRISIIGDSANGGGEDGSILLFATDGGAVQSYLGINQGTVNDMVITAGGELTSASSIGIGLRIYTKDVSADPVQVARFAPGGDLTLENNLIVSGTGTFSDLTLSDISPTLNLVETDTTTNARVILTGGVTYLQAGQAGSGGASAGGALRITGYLSSDIGELTVTAGGSSSAFKIDGATGNVGLGTASPSTKLHVDGDARFDGNLTVGAVEIETPDHNGAVIDGVTNDLTAINAMVTAMKTNNGMGLFPAGSYNYGGTVYTLTHDNLLHIGDYSGSINPLVGARQHNMTIFAETVSDATFDNDKTRIGLAVSAYAKGGQRVDGIRVNGYNQSTGSNGGVTGTYTAMTSDTGADWSAAVHGELYHAAGTGIGGNIEVTGFSSTGSVYGLVIFNGTGEASNDLQTHSITGASPDMPSTNAAINIHGSQDHLDDGGWMTGIDFSTLSMHPSGTAIYIKDDAAYGVRATGSYSTAAYLMAATEKFAYDATAAITTHYTGGSIVWANGATSRMSLAMSSGNFYASGSIRFNPGSSVTPTNNGDVMFELTSNTTLTIKAKGSDGVVRSGTVTLA